MLSSTDDHNATNNSTTSSSNKNLLQQPLLQNDAILQPRRQSTTLQKQGSSFYKRKEPQSLLNLIPEDDNHPFRPKYDDEYFEEELEGESSGAKYALQRLTRQQDESAAARVNRSLNSVQSYLYNILEQPKRRGKRIGRVINFVIFLLIFISIINYVLGTEPTLLQLEWFNDTNYIIEQLCLGIFCVEFLARVYACTAPESRYYHQFGPILGRLRYLVSFQALVDMFSIVPSLIISIVYVITQQDWSLPIVRELVALRVLRVLKLLKADKYLNATALIRDVVVKKRRELTISLFLYVVTVLFVGSLAYYAEKDQQPADFGTILKGIYWACMAMSTGNIYGVPLSDFGKIINVATGLLGITFVALPTSIIGYGFVEELEVRMSEAEEAKRKKEEETRKRIVEMEEQKEKENPIENATPCTITCPNCSHNFVKKIQVNLI